MAYNFDNLKADAMNLFDKAASKTAEAIDYSKNQIDRAQLRAKIKRKIHRAWKALLQYARKRR